MLGLGKKNKAVTSEENGIRVSMTEDAACQRSLSVEVSGEALEPIRTEVVKAFRKEANIKGFRKGKAPVEIVAQQYADSIQQETLQRATQQAFQQAAKAHDLNPVGPFEISKSDFSNGGLTLEARVDVEPEFELQDYKGIELTREPVTIADNEREAALKQLQESMAQLVPGKDASEPKERQVPDVDDELAKDLGFESLDKLKVHVDERLTEQKRSAQEQALRSTLLNTLVERHDFEVPKRLVEHQIERLKQDLKARMIMGGTEEGKIEEELSKAEPQVKVSAERNVKLGFIMDRIAREESIEVKENDVLAHVWNLAQRWQKDPTEVRAALDKEKLWGSVIASIRQDKTIEMLMNAARINGEIKSDAEGNQEVASEDEKR